MVADLFFLSILSIFTLRGLYKGLVRETLSLLGFFGGIVVAHRYAPMIGGKILEVSDRITSLAYPLSFLILFILVISLSHIFALIISFLLGATKLSLLDRVLGGGVGLLKGLVISMVIVAGITRLPQEWTKGWIEGSILFKTLLEGLELMKDISGGVI